MVHSLHSDPEGEASLSVNCNARLLGQGVESSFRSSIPFRQGIALLTDRTTHNWLHFDQLIPCLGSVLTESLFAFSLIVGAHSWDTWSMQPVE